jgi:TRAP-type C4-dicarboxylate transport system permease small subunit
MTRRRRLIVSLLCFAIGSALIGYHWVAELNAQAVANMLNTLGQPVTIGTGLIPEASLYTGIVLVAFSIVLGIRLLVRGRSDRD